MAHDLALLSNPLPLVLRVDICTHLPDCLLSRSSCLLCTHHVPDEAAVVLGYQQHGWQYLLQQLQQQTMQGVCSTTATHPSQNTRQCMAGWTCPQQQQQQTLALLFIAPSVAIKWTLVVYLGDFSFIPVLSTVVSTLSFTLVLTSFFATTYIYGSVWTFKQRAMGVAAVAAVVLGQFLWRLAARSWLVLKFGGEAYMVWMYLSHAAVAVSVFARGSESRRAYYAAYKSTPVPVFLLTMSAAAALVSNNI